MAVNLTYSHEMNRNEKENQIFVLNDKDAIRMRNHCFQLKWIAFGLIDSHQFHNCEDLLSCRVKVTRNKYVPSPLKYKYCNLQHHRLNINYSVR